MNSSPSSFRIHQRVSIIGKGLGTIAFIGKTEFAEGEWIGVILDEAKGKNNGTVQKKDGTWVRYFTCQDNHGLYVRPGQVEFQRNSSIGGSLSNRSRTISKLSTQVSELPLLQTVPSSSSHDLPDQPNEPIEAMFERIRQLMEKLDETELQIESLSLDLQIAEEKLELVTSENVILKEKLQSNEINSIRNRFEKTEVDNERMPKLEEALIKLRDYSLSLKADNEILRKRIDENEQLKIDLTAAKSTINDLFDQIDTFASTQRMVDELTTKNLTLEDQVRQLQEEVENLESLYEMDKEIEENAKEVEQDLRQTIDFLQNQLHDKERHIEKLQYSIADYERTILKFRQSLKISQMENEEMKQQFLKYEQQLQIIGSNQSKDFKSKIIQNQTYASMLQGEVKKIEVICLTRQIELLNGFLPEPMMKRGSDYDCLLLVVLFPRLIAKCDLLINEIQEKFPRISIVTLDELIQSYHVEQCSYAWKLSFSISMYRLILKKFEKVIQLCSTTSLRELAGAYSDLVIHERSLDVLVDLLAKDQIYDSAALNILDKSINFYRHIFQAYLSEELFPVSNYLQDLSRLVLIACEALHIDFQRFDALQRTGVDQSPLTLLIKQLYETNQQIEFQANKIHRLSIDESQKTRYLQIDTKTMTSLELVVHHLDRLIRSFHEICVHLSTRVLMLVDTNEAIRLEDIESFAYQACDQIYEKEDRGPYESFQDSMDETLQILDHVRQQLENGFYDRYGASDQQQQGNESQAIKMIGGQLRISINECEALRYRLEKRDEEIVELKKILKIKQEDFDESNLRLLLNEKRVESLQREFDEKIAKQKEIIEEIRVDAQRKINCVEIEFETLEQEKNFLKERLKEFGKNKLIDELHNEKSPSTFTRTEQRSNNARSVELEHEIETLKNTVRLLKEDLWQMKIARTSNDLKNLSNLEENHSNHEFIDIYQQSTLLMKDLYSTIANYKITGDHVDVKQEILRSKLKLIDQTAANVNQRFHQFQNHFIPGSTISTDLKFFPNPKFKQVH